MEEKEKLILASPSVQTSLSFLNETFLSSQLHKAKQKLYK